jgi:dodecin
VSVARTPAVEVDGHVPGAHGLRADIAAVERRTSMSVAKVSEISATSPKSFEDAIQQGLTRAAKTLRKIRSAWIKEQHVRCDGDRIAEYQVNMMVTFVLDD